MIHPHPPFVVQISLLLPGGANTAVGLPALEDCVARLLLLATLAEQTGWMPTWWGL